MLVLWTCSTISAQFTDKPVSVPSGRFHFPDSPNTWRYVYKWATRSTMREHYISLLRDYGTMFTVLFCLSRTAHWHYRETCKVELSQFCIRDSPPPPFCCKRSWRVGIHPANLAVIRNQKIQLPAFQNAESRMVHRCSSTADKYHFNLHPARACTSRSRSNCIRAYPLTYGFFPINPVTKSHNWAFHHWYCLYPI